MAFVFSGSEHDGVERRDEEEAERIEGKDSDAEEDGGEHQDEEGPGRGLLVEFRGIIEFRFLAVSFETRLDVSPNVTWSGSRYGTSHVLTSRAAAPAVENTSFGG